jgi:LL-diaminopimelate aminotransferase
VNEAKAYYMHNAKIMREALIDMGFKVYGGLHAPYIWIQTPDETDSRHFADSLLYGCGVVCTPGIGYGPGGEKYCRFTTFTDRRNIEEALQRIGSWQR